MAGLSSTLQDVMAEAWRHGPLRILWDNRVTVAMGPGLTEMFPTMFVERGEPEHRLAIIVANSLKKGAFAAGDGGRAPIVGVDVPH